MKYNDTNNDDIDNDDMDIKSHLDASLDLSGISVSEELINRTLEAIKKQESQQPAAQGGINTDSSNKKIIPWNRYIRGFAGVAAAAVILVAGYNVLNNSGMKKDSSKMDSATTADNGINAEEPAEENTMFTAQGTEDMATKASDAAETTENADINNVTDDSTLTEIAPNYSIAAGIVAESDENNSFGSTPEEVAPSITSASVDTEGVAVGAAEGSAGSTSSADAKTTQPSTEKEMMKDAKLTFVDIFLSDPEKAQYITLTDNANGTTINITEPSAILDFYDVMSKHQFTYGSEDTTEQNYTVEIGNPEVDATYFMTVGNYITVSYTDQVTSSQSIYEVQDEAQLSKDLSDFIAKYKK